MINPDGHHVGWRHNHAHAEPRRIKKPFGKIIGHADATMRGRVPRQGATMQRDARPSEALHVGHVGIIIHVGVMLGFLLKDAEDSSWCLTSFCPLDTGARMILPLTSYTVICWSRSETIAMIGSPADRCSIDRSF